MIFHEEHMRVEMTPPPREPSARVAPLSPRTGSGALVYYKQGLPG